MGKQYSIEFAVESSSELKAMDRLKALGITNAPEAKLSDLDRQADLYIVKVSADESELSDETYKKLLEAKDMFILSDELSEKRAQEIIKLTAPVEQQLKKLLICVLPETEKVLGHIIETHQKHKSTFQPTSRVEWCQKISDFSFGGLPKVLEEDIAELAKKQLLSSEGLLSLIVSAKDFNALKEELVELSKPKTVWDSVCTMLEKPAKYGHVSGALIDLCNARNEAAHLNTITAKRLKEVKKSQKHVMSCIGKTKSNYQDDLQESMKIFAKSMKSLMESAVKIDPSIFQGYQKMITETFKPLTETIAKLQLDVASPSFANIIKQNTTYQSQISKGLTDSINNMMKLDPSGYQETMRQLTSTGIPETMAEYVKGVGEMNLDIDVIIHKGVNQHEESSANSGELSTDLNNSEGSASRSEDKND